MLLMRVTDFINYAANLGEVVEHYGLEAVTDSSHLGAPGVLESRYFVAREFWGSKRTTVSTPKYRPKRFRDTAKKLQKRSNASRNCA